MSCLQILRPWAFVPFLIILINCVKAEPIYHEKYYPNGKGPFPTVIALHTSGGINTIKHLIHRYVDDGFAVYLPDFFRRHGLNKSLRMHTFNLYRKEIEQDLSTIVGLMRDDPRVEHKNIFAVGFSNGGFWVCYLAGTSQVNAGVAHYGVWKANYGKAFRNPYPMKYFSSLGAPVLALHGAEDSIQKIRYAEWAWQEITMLGGNLETYVYPNADHAWDRKNSSIYMYIRDVDKNAHKRTIKFFRKYLK